MKIANLALGGSVLAAQVPLDQLDGYRVASEALGGIADLDVQNVWRELYESEPLRVKKALDPFSGPGGRPSKFVQTQDWAKVVENPLYPNYALRVKDPSKLGVDDTKQWSGYIDVLEEDKHFFFWMFESRNDPENDPVILWLNGGPGCSSATGLFFELGPAKVNSDLTLTKNPYAWNNNATVIFLDQPVNVGFSYSENRVGTSTLAAVDVYSFLSLFFTEFPEYTGKDFHIAGESYGGHYLPAIGYEIIQHEDRVFNFTSLLIGNGITDALNQADAQISMACGLGGYPSILDAETCDELYGKLPRCLSLLDTCYKTETPLVCLGASLYCETLSKPYYDTGRNPYDVRDVCYDTCYNETQFIDLYLNQTHVKKALGAEPIEFESCSSSVFTDFTFRGDEGLPFTHQVTEILESGIPILIYAGDKDYICNWLGNQDWTNKLEWSLHDEFADALLVPWYIDGKEAGRTKSAGNFTFLRVYDAGHMVPFNKPKQSLVMLNQWLARNHQSSKLH